MKLNLNNSLIQRRLLLKMSGMSAIGAAAAQLSGCFDSSKTPAAPVPASAVPAPVLAPAPVLKNNYLQQNLVGSNASYAATFTDASFVNAWGIAIRPKGAGGHFWVGAGGASFQYVGDVKASKTPNLAPFSQDGLKVVTVSGADARTDDASKGKITGVVFNGAELDSKHFRVNGQTATQTTTQGAVKTKFDGSARFVFVTDSGKVSAWTDRSSTGEIVRVDGAAQEKYDGGADGSAFFGAAVKTDTWDTLWLADFGAKPRIVTLDDNWKKVPTVGFVNPFGSGASSADSVKSVVPGDPVPFNIQVLDGSVFVTYAISRANPIKGAPKGSFYAAEEDALDTAAETASGDKPNKGKLVEFSLAGQLIRIFDDALRLNAPWGLAIAPADYGLLSGAVLVGNFGGTGRICAFKRDTGVYLDDVRDKAGKPVGIAGLWGLQFGNGESLGDTHALYFAAGPEDEKDGLFGSLRYAVA